MFERYWNVNTLFIIIIYNSDFKRQSFSPPDPLLIARPAFWRATIWWDVLFFGPFYIFAIDAFARGKDWIRVPSIIYATCIVTIVTIILTEEAYGIHASNDIFAVFAANGPWLCVPLALLARMAFAGEKPFSRVVEEGKKEN